MSSFTPYNVEPDSDTEEEIDDTKEIQVEEALKLYQNALKLHSQGPKFFDEAEGAYNELFRSEIFTYPESQSEAKRLEAQDDVESEAEDVDLGPLAVPVAGAETAPNALPQLLYLSYKNYGQFLLDRLAREFSLLIRSDSLESQIAERSIGTRSLIQFTEALGRDGTDLDLWMRTSRLGQILGSKRLARFCLEAVLSDGAEEDLSLEEEARIEEALAREELDELVSSLRPELPNQLLPSKASGVKPIPKAMKALMDPCPNIQTLPMSKSSDSEEIGKELVVAPTWEALGKAILETLESWAQSDSNLMTRLTIVVDDAEAGSPRGKRPRALVAPESLMKRRNTKELGLTSKENVVDSAPTQDAGKAATQSPHAPKTASSIDRNENTEKANPHTTEPESAITDASPLKSSHVHGESANAAESRANLKRNSDAAGLQDAAEGVRVRSKRLRARAEIAEEDNEPKDMFKHYEEQLEPCNQTDNALFAAAQDLCSKVGLEIFQDASDMRQSVFMNTESGSSDAKDRISTSVYDFKEALCRWDLNKSNLLLHGSGSGASVTLIGGGGDDSGLTAFLEHSKPGLKKSPAEVEVLDDQGLRQLVPLINEAWTDMERLVALWLEALLTSPDVDQDQNRSPSRYMQYLWSPSFKRIALEVLTKQDHWIFDSLEKRLLASSQLLTESKEEDSSKSDGSEKLPELIQTIFEIHLDLYQEITQPNSKVDQPSRMMQRDRMRRWARLSNSAVACEPSFELEDAVRGQIALRHLWSSVMYVSVIESASRDHVLLCLRDLESTLRKADIAPIYIPNNPAMPAISADAAEAEISRLTTMDFFMGIFDPDLDEPVAVIEALEPILMASDSLGNLQSQGKAPDDDSSTSTIYQDATEDQGESTPNQDSARNSVQMSEFLGKATASLRLSLWHQLRTAYDAIEYPPMVFLCNIHSLATILTEIRSTTFENDSPESRTANLIVWIRNVVDLVTQCVDLALSEKDALLCLDKTHLRTALSACAGTIELLHTFALWEDSIRVGQAQPPSQATGAAVPYRASMNFLREVQPKVWVLFYFVVRELLLQNPMSFPNLNQSLLSLLSATHGSFAARDYCKLGKKAFVKFEKSELLSLGAAHDAEDELAQVLFDLYGLKLCPTSQYDEHGSTADPLDRPTALDIVEFVMLQARRLNIKDLLKSDIKVATEKMQAVIGIPRASSLHQSFNRRLILAYLRSPINPLNLYRSLKGLGGLSGMPVTTDFAAVADQRWFFLLGHILLARHRSQKRTSPDTSNDLDDAIMYMKLDLDFDTENWETWYRLGQAYDSKIEEDTTWNADKINDEKSDLVSLQRQTIQCYTMALAVAVRNADDSFETAGKVTDLYTDFGNRIYASSRAPFSMQVFGLQDYERFCNGMDRGTYKREPFRPLKEPAAWTFASELFRLALADRPDEWVNWFMLGKCLWKLFRCSKSSSVDCLQPLDAFIRAIECAPEKRDSRHPDRDPILEPHYKLVSIVHKLVHGGHLQPEEGAQILDVSPHTRKDRLASHKGWKDYILSVLKTLRSADKANWHHRMVVRAAHIQYDDDTNNRDNAVAAKSELTQQIFTKTMTVQVWKPDFERAGRHFIYTTQYVRLFVRLLFQTDDRAGLEGLGKKVRKKQGDFIDHTLVWSEICLAHLHLLRSQGRIPENHEDTVFKTLLPYEVFTQNAARLEEWAHSPEAKEHETLDHLREVIELKKLNGNLMRPTLLDDLIGDTYARIYEQVVPGLAARAAAAAAALENRDRMRIDQFLTASDAADGAEQAARAGTPGDQAPTTSRLKTIGRTEVRRRAEALVAKPNAGPPARGRPAASSTVSTEPKAGAAKGSSEPSAGKDVAESAPPSVHDSADDESELTDIDEEEEEPKVEEEEEPAPMFPGLRKNSGPAADAQGDEKSEKGEDEAEKGEESKDVDMGGT